MARRMFKTNPAEEPEEDLTSRTDRRKERLAEEEALLRLAETLVGMSEQAAARLNLPENVLDPIADARLVRSATARNRVLRLVRAGLRELDQEALRRLRKAVPDHRRRRG